MAAAISTPVTRTVIKIIPTGAEPVFDGRGAVVADAFGRGAAGAG